MRAKEFISEAKRRGKMTNITMMKMKKNQKNLKNMKKKRKHLNINLKKKNLRNQPSL